MFRLYFTITELLSVRGNTENNLQRKAGHSVSLSVGDKNQGHSGSFLCHWGLANRISREVTYCSAGGHIWPFKVVKITSEPPVSEVTQPVTPPLTHEAHTNHLLQETLTPSSHGTPTEVAARIALHLGDRAGQGSWAKKHLTGATGPLQADL